jgi:general secretion pathway protein D
VIAGLIGDDTDYSVTKVPCLGDIPILGWLFRSESTTTRRTNLLVFLTPYIVANPQEAEKIYQEKSTYIDEVQKEALDASESTEEPQEGENSKE